jgi:hypothetical protein
MKQNNTKWGPTEARPSMPVGFFGTRTSVDRAADRPPRELLPSELAQVREAWARYQETRDRDGVYHYLEAVFALVGKWTRLRCAQSRSKRALRSQNIQPKGRVEPFAAVIACTGKVHDRTISKWARALRYAAQFKRAQEGLADFIKRHGGINACAALFSGAGSQSRKRSR